jgi:hypothetical protein
MIESFISREMINHGLTQLIAMMLTIFFIPRLWVTSPLGAIGILISISIVNATFWDANLFYFLPDNIGVNTIKLLIGNGALFWVLVKLVPGIKITGVLPALIAPVVFTLISTILNIFSAQIDWLTIIEYLFSLFSSYKESVSN